MSTTAAMRASRQGLVIATAATIHGVAFVLVTTGLLPRISFTEPPAIEAKIVPRQTEPAVPVAPEPSGAPDYELPLEPQPLIEWPTPDETPAAADGLPAGTGSAGEGVRARTVEFVSPALRTRDSRLAGLVDRCYPAAARRRNEEGRVGVRVTVNVNGRAGAYGVAEGSGFPLLDAAVDCVLRRLEFEPGRRDGTAVEATVSLPIVFRLD
jgi:periplasmic protein TonB